LSIFSLPVRRPDRRLVGPPCVALILCAAAALADDQPQCTHRAVAPDDWTYSAMRCVLRSVRVDGLSPVRFTGDYTFSAREMAEMVWRAYEAASRADALTEPKVRRWLAALAGEFCWELESMGKPVADALARLRDGWTEGAQLFGQAEAGIAASGEGAPVYGTGQVGLAAFPNSPTHMAMAEVGYRPAEARQDRLGRPPLTRAAMFWRRPEFQADLGHDAFRMGPGVRSGFTYGGLANPFDRARYRDRFQILGTRLVVDASLAALPENGQRTYLAVRRIEKRISPEIEAAFTESAKTTIVPSGWYYVLPMETVQGVKERLAGQPGLYQETDNILMHGELYWRASPWVELYAEGALDELDFNGLLADAGVKNWLASIPLFQRLNLFQGEPGSNENQGGYLVGAYLPDVLGNRRLRARCEYAFSSRLMGVSSRYSSLDFMFGDRPLQHRIGPDARGWYLEADYLSGGKWAAKAFAEGTHRGLSRPNVEAEWLVGCRWTRQLGHDTALRLGLTRRLVNNEDHVAGRRRSTTTLTAGAQWWF